MNKLILIKYGELSTKKANINLFLKQLKSDIVKKLDGLEVNVTFDKGRMFIRGSEENFDEIIKKLHEVFGIHAYNIAYELDTNDLNEIGSNIINLIKDKEYKTFKVNTKRSDKKYPLTSVEISKKIGGIILKNTENKTVDIHNPELNVNVELRVNKTYIYFNDIKGLGGYPVGVAGKGLLMLSGGIDSPVAGYLAMKRGVKLECLYFESPPHTSVEAKNKVIELATKLSKYNGEMKIHVINFTEIQRAIY